MEQPLEAQVIDARHLKLKKPIEIPPGSKVFIRITPTEEEAAGDRDWYALSGQRLDVAYGEDEPDYPFHLIKTPNPDFQQ